MTLPDNIFLIGMMGSWKSTIGRRLAQQFAMTFVDTDDEVEKTSGRSIREIVESGGMKDFRALEEDVLRRVARTTGQVVATGGGIILSRRNRKIICRNGFTILLRSSPAVLLKRIRNLSRRPLLQNADEPAKTLEGIWKERKKKYERVADIIIDTDDKDPLETRKLIVNCLKEHYAEN
jgi:shikimate kinase